MKLNKKNLSKMTPKQKKEYKKRLAATLEYTRARSAWQKALKEGTVDKSISLAQFRVMKDVNKSMKNLKIDISDIERAHDVAKEDNMLINKLQNMINEIKGSQKKHSALLEALSKITG